MTITASAFLVSGTNRITLASVVNTNTVTLNGVVLTATSGSTSGANFHVGATDTLTAVELASIVAANVTGLTATSSGAVVTVPGPLTSYASTSTMTLAAVGTVNQPTGVLITVSNSASTVVNITDASLTVTPDGLNYQAVPVNKGVIPIGPGQVLAVPGSGSLVLQSGVIPYMAPQGQTFTYDVGASITTNDTSPPTVTSATAALFRVTGTVVG